jgi:hypothetical protein
MSQDLRAQAYRFESGGECADCPTKSFAYLISPPGAYILTTSDSMSSASESSKATPNLHSTRLPLVHRVCAKMDANEAPTFNGLNKPQRRALVLREELRLHDNRHLDTFIEGISAEEPPAYMRHNDTVYPPLTEVKLKESAARFDFGNVHFDTDVILGTGVFHTWLVVEDGRFELRTDEPLPSDDQVIQSVPIYAFIAKQMAPLFEQKFRAIWARKNQINEIRQIAFKLADSQPADEFRPGEVCDFD